MVRSPLPSRTGPSAECVQRQTAAATNGRTSAHSRRTGPAQLAVVPPGCDWNVVRVRTDGGTGGLHLEPRPARKFAGFDAGARGAFASCERWSPRRELASGYEATRRRFAGITTGSVRNFAIALAIPLSSVGPSAM